MGRSGFLRQARGSVRDWLGNEAGAARIDRVFPAFLGGALFVVLAVTLVGHERAKSVAETGAAADAAPERRVISSSSRGEAPVEPAEGEARGYVSNDYPGLHAPREDTEQQRLDAEVAIAREQVILPEPLPSDDPAAADPAATDAAAGGEAPAETTAEGEAAAGSASDGS